MVHETYKKNPHRTSYFLPKDVMQRFLKYDTKSTGNNKIDKLDFTKIKNFCVPTNVSREGKDSSQNGRKYVLIL